MKKFENPIVYIIDVDQYLLDSLSKRLSVYDVNVAIFTSAEDFLKTKFRVRSACLIVEVNLPNMDGIELLQHINNLGIRLPTIVMSSDGDVSEAVRAMQAKAIDFYEKPFVENTLVARVLDVLALP
jgi:FixJ family two-component response regulator